MPRPVKSFHKKKGWKRLEDRQPKVIENTKKAIFMKGRNSSQLLTELTEDLALYKKPYVLKFNHKHEVLPFEDERPFEAYSTGRDCSLIMLSSHNKKRPHCLTLIRMFDGHILDMLELLVSHYKSISSFSGDKPPSATRIMYTFVGSLFETNEDFRMFKNMIIDFYRNDVKQSLVVDELTAMMTFVAVDGKIHMTVHNVKTSKSGVKLNEVGPQVIMTPGRSKYGAEDMREEAMTIPPELQPAKKKKNVSKDVFGQTIGRVHAVGEDLDKLSKRVKLPKALRVDKKQKKLAK
ncbi:Ribosome production factor 2-like protein [Entamoeba marina]